MPVHPMIIDIMVSLDRLVLEMEEVIRDGQITINVHPGQAYLL